MAEASFTCPRCGMTSHNADDVREGYCGNCHAWTGVPFGLPAPREGDEVAINRTGEPPVTVRVSKVTEPRDGTLILNLEPLEAKDSSEEERDG